MLKWPHRSFPFLPPDEKSNLPSPALIGRDARKVAYLFENRIPLSGNVAILFYPPDGSSSIIIFLFHRKIPYPLAQTMKHTETR
jgi:hypothetical protein